MEEHPSEKFDAPEYHSKAHEFKILQRSPLVLRHEPTGTHIEEHSMPVKQVTGFSHSVIHTPVNLKGKGFNKSNTIDQHHSLYSAMSSVAEHPRSVNQSESSSKNLAKARAAHHDKLRGAFTGAHGNGRP